VLRGEQRQRRSSRGRLAYACCVDAALLSAGCFEGGGSGGRFGGKEAVHKIAAGTGWKDTDECPPRAIGKPSPRADGALEQSRAEGRAFVDGARQCAPAKLAELDREVEKVAAKWVVPVSG
jgi:hypothetical protein